jgi:4-diphosphocytidyl-2-C-methyl-D-erythritol kinase
VRVRRDGDTWVARAPAKLNLFFEVLAKRGDGFHEIETLMCPIDLCDTLYFTDDAGGQVRLSCEYGDNRGGGNEGTLPEGPDNLVWRAVELLRSRANVRSGAKLRLIKRIPMQAGLGGGSSDAAAALLLANLGWNLGCSKADLTQLAGELGSDVPFFIEGGWAVCRGRGERVEQFDAGGLLHFVVVCPPVGLATAAVYAACIPAMNPRPLASFLNAMGRGDISGLGRSIYNRLQPAASRLSPWIERLRQEFDLSDCLGHGMSGSGSSYFGLCRHARQARRIARRLAARNIGRAFAVRSGC